MALGSASKKPSVSEAGNRGIARKSLVADCDIKAGETFTPENITTKRPGTGRSPMEYWDVIGTVAQKDYQPDDLI